MINNVATAITCILGDESSDEEMEDLLVLAAVMDMLEEEVRAHEDYDAFLRGCGLIRFNNVNL